MESARARVAIRRTTFALETLGLVIILYYWVPLYRRLLGGPGGDRPGAGIAWKVLAAVVVMQICYWSRWKFPAVLLSRRGVLAGHLLLFLSRLAFVFVGSSFTLFLIRAPDTRGSPVGVAAGVLALFAIFCYVLELEQRGRSRLEPRPSGGRTG